VFGSDGSVRDISPKRNIQANTGNCTIYKFVNSPVELNNDSFSTFDDLVTLLEEDQESSAQLSEGRRWVADSFYMEAPTLASLRLSAGLSQKQLGQACGIEQPHVSRYESGKHDPSLSVAAKMASALGVDLDLFFLAWNNSCAMLQSEILK